MDKTGNLYGTTTTGGQADNGSVFELTAPAEQGDPWIETTLTDFANRANGRQPTAGLTFGKRGRLYGTTVGGGGHSGDGTVFSIVP
jgi:uncharacterized repeat protein (TIGR03803 family)